MNYELRIGNYDRNYELRGMLFIWFIEELSYAC